MKKIILILALLFSASSVLISCKGEKKENSEENEVYENHAAEKADIAMNNVYQCPMDCEEGKTYEEKGSCPVCKMGLKKVEGEEHDDDENHDEDNDSKEEHDGDEK